MEPTKCFDCRNPPAPGRTRCLPCAQKHSARSQRWKRANPTKVKAHRAKRKAVNHKRTLVRKAQKGHQAPFNEYAAQMRSWVTYFVRYYIRSLPKHHRPDLEQEGFMGMWEGVMRCDLSRCKSPDAFVRGWIWKRIRVYAEKYGNGSRALVLSDDKSTIVRPAIISLEGYVEATGMDPAEFIADPQAATPFGEFEYQHDVQALTSDFTEEEMAIFSERLNTDEPTRRKDVGLGLGISRESVRRRELVLKEKLKEAYYADEQ